MAEPSKRLYRSTDDRLIGGVCGGLAEYFGIDATLVRLVWVVLTLVTSLAPGVIVYILALLLMPERPYAEAAEPEALEESIDVRSWAEERDVTAVDVSAEDDER